MNHDDVTASVYVSGVSLGCVNSGTKKWEVGFIREPRHTLMAEIIKIRAGQRDTVIHRPSPIQPTRIIIEADRPVYKETTRYKRKGDPEDFPLLLDVEKEVYRNNRLKLKKPTCAVVEMYVSNAKLYSVAGMLSAFDVLIVRTDQLRDVRKRGKVGTAAGADIKCEEGGHVFIRVDGPGGFEYRLPHENGSRYIIMLDNQCPLARAAGRKAKSSRTSTAAPSTISKLTNRGASLIPHSDFVLYYEMLNPEGKGFFDLQKDNPKRGEGAVCNYSDMGKTEGMFPLPITDP